MCTEPLSRAGGRSPAGTAHCFPTASAHARCFTSILTYIRDFQFTSSFLTLACVFTFVLPVTVTLLGKGFIANLRLFLQSPDHSCAHMRRHPVAPAPQGPPPKRRDAAVPSPLGWDSRGKARLCCRRFLSPGNHLHFWRLSWTLWEFQFGDDSVRPPPRFYVFAMHFSF